MQCTYKRNSVTRRDDIPINNYFIYNIFVRFGNNTIQIFIQIILAHTQSNLHKKHAKNVGHKLNTYNSKVTNHLPINLHQAPVHKEENYGYRHFARIFKLLDSHSNQNLC